jgi:hypothetical protein
MPVSEQQFVEALEGALTTSLKNGMTLKMVKERVPAHISKKMGMSVREFHSTLAHVEGRSGFDTLVTRVVNSLTPAERARVR